MPIGGPKEGPSGTVLAAGAVVRCLSRRWPGRYRSARAIPVDGADHFLSAVSLAAASVCC